MMMVVRAGHDSWQLVSFLEFPCTCVFLDHKNMGWWWWREPRGGRHLSIYLERGHTVQGTHNLDGAWWADPGRREMLAG